MLFPEDLEASAMRASRASTPPSHLLSRKRIGSEAADRERPEAGSRQSVFSFGSGIAEGTREWRDILGGKGANPAEMTNLGIPVPPGFTIACPACDEYLSTRTIPKPLRAEVERALLKLQVASTRSF